MSALEIATPHGRARATLLLVDAPRGALVLGHGAAGGVDAPDIRAAARAARSSGLHVALVEQPYRVAGRRVPPRGPQLDAAFVAVLADLRAGLLDGLALVVGGRSLGARVACRTAADVDPVAVLCLAFPLRPPGRRSSAPPASRLPELDAVRVPTLVVQGDRDPFGMPPAGPRRTVVAVRGDHGLRGDLDAVEEAVARWLGEVLPAPHSRGRARAARSPREPTRQPG